MVALNSFDSVILQFSFSGFIPQMLVLKWKEKETLSELKQRKEKKMMGDGEKVIEPTQNCSFEDFLVDLEAMGYKLADAFCQERIDAKDPKSKRTYHMIRFIFLPEEYVVFSEDHDKFRRALFQICEESLWRVRAFSNPGPDSEEHLSINLEGRTPLRRPDGQPVTVWQKDENGERVGDAPVPITPAYSLRVREGAVRLVTE